MHELEDLRERVLDAKRRLKEAYYTAADGDTRADAKELVTATIDIEKAVEGLIDIGTKSDLARRLLDDRKIELMVRKWSIGLMTRVEDYVKKQKSLPAHHLHRYFEVLREYIHEILEELSTWTREIQNAIETQSLPRE